MMPPLPTTVTHNTRYELWRYFDDKVPDVSGRWVLWHTGRTIDRLKRLRTRYLNKGIPAGHLRMIAVSEERRIIP